MKKTPPRSTTSTHVVGTKEEWFTAPDGSRHRHEVKVYGPPVVEAPAPEPESLRDRLELRFPDLDADALERLLHEVEGEPRRYASLREALADSAPDRLRVEARKYREAAKQIRRWRDAHLRHVERREQAAFQALEDLRPGEFTAEANPENRAAEDRWWRRRADRLDADATGFEREAAAADAAKKPGPREDAAGYSVARSLAEALRGVRVVVSPANLERLAKALFAESEQRPSEWVLRKVAKEGGRKPGRRAWWARAKAAKNHQVEVPGHAARWHQVQQGRHEQLGELEQQIGADRRELWGRIQGLVREFWRNKFPGR